MKNMFRVSLTLLVLSLSITVQADNFRLFVGQMKTLALPGIDRVAVGNSGLVSTSIMDNGELLVLAENAGDTEIQIWLKDGEVIAHKFYIIPANTARNVAEIRSIVGRVKGLSVRQVGSNIILKGAISHQASAIIKKVSSVYTNVLDLTTATASSDLAEVFKNMPNVIVRNAGNKLVVSGDVSDEDKAYIEAVKSSYPELLDLTNSNATKPMVYLNVKITEFSNKAAENLGVAWAGSAQGPSLHSNTFNGDAYNPDGLPDLTYGIVSSLTSILNFAISSGEALILASPTLSALSGSEAEFLAGGEFPVAVPDGNGGTAIEYKEYGIILKIKPVVDSQGRIIASIDIEISSIDSSVTVNGAPGLKKRKTTTEVSLKQGQTFAISGLVNREISKDISRFPFLSKIPVLGALFRSKNFADNRSDLIIFITPNIVDADSKLNTEQLAEAAAIETKFFTNNEFNLEIIE
ncbi:MAG: pilus assembly protein N-terminal domain-containing protein [Oceanospirillaceae bacterium]|nr:pilus assembly protein N-terminal domain-containing protein [Oceanospirillaceae bacterium]